MAENEKEVQTPADEKPSQRATSFKVIVLVSVLAALAAVGGLALLLNIFERRQEARNPFYRVVELTDDTEDPAQGSSFSAKLQ